MSDGRLYPPSLKCECAYIYICLPGNCFADRFRSKYLTAPAGFLLSPFVCVALFWVGVVHGSQLRKAKLFESLVSLVSESLDQETSKKLHKKKKRRRKRKMLARRTFYTSQRTDIGAEGYCTLSGCSCYVGAKDMSLLNVVYVEDIPLR